MLKYVYNFRKEKSKHLIILVVTKLRFKAWFGVFL